jgi:type VI secretion system secreted protein Hcp
MAASGNKGVTAKIHFVTSGNPGHTYLEYTLSNVLISNYKVASAGDRPAEEITLDFTKMEMKYTAYDSNHAAESPLIASYDIATTQSN